LTRRAVQTTASAAARAALTQFGSPDETGLLFDRYWVTALVADSRGDAPTAREALQPICGQVQLGCYAIGITQHHRLPQLTQIALRCGDHGAAAVLAAAAQDLARRNPHADTIVAAGCHAQGLIEHNKALLTEAVARAGQSEAPLIEAAAREDLAALLTGPAAVEQLERAYASYTRRFPP
jgi:hypothetical protein